MKETIISSVIKATHNRMICFDLRSVEDSPYELRIVLIGDEGIEYDITEKYSSFEMALAYYKAYVFEARPIKFPLDKKNYIEYYVEGELQNIIEKDKELSEKKG